MIINMILRNAFRKCLARKLPNAFQMSKTCRSEIIYEEEDKVVCDFQKLEIVNSQIDSLVIVNNKLNEEWLYKGLEAAHNVVLADGGANRFYETPFRHWRNVRAIVGDFDSLLP